MRNGRRLPHRVQMRSLWYVQVDPTTMLKNTLKLVTSVITHATDVNSRRVNVSIVLLRFSMTLSVNHGSWIAITHIHGARGCCVRIGQREDCREIVDTGGGRDSPGFTWSKDMGKGNRRGVGT